MHGARRNYRYVWDVSACHVVFFHCFSLRFIYLSHLASRIVINAPKRGRLKVRLPLIAVLVLITILFATTNVSFLVYLRTLGSRWHLQMVVTPLYPKSKRRRAFGLGRFFRLLLSHRKCRTIKRGHGD